MNIFSLTNFCFILPFFSFFCTWSVLASPVYKFYNGLIRPFSAREVQYEFGYIYKGPGDVQSKIIAG